MAVTSSGVYAQESKPQAAPKLPAACFFLSRGGVEVSWGKDIPEEERVYTRASAHVFNLWCESNSASEADKLKAADEMTKAWKRLWDRDDPFNAHFHEQGAWDLLVLMALTHRLPAPMRTNPAFVEEWSRECGATCFELWIDPDKPSDQRFVMELFGMVQDLRHHLKEEPAAEPVVNMLYNAQFSLGD